MFAVIISPPVGGAGKTPHHLNSTQSRRRRHFRPFLNFDKRRREVAGDVISGRLMGPDVPDKRLKFGDPRNNLSREIALKPSEVTFSTVFPW